MRRWTVLQAAVLFLSLASLQGCVPFAYGERFEGSKCKVAFREAKTGKPIERILVVSLRTRNRTMVAGPDGPVGAEWQAAYIDRAFVYRSGSEFPSLSRLRSAGVALGPSTFNSLEQLVAVAPGCAPSPLIFDARKDGWTIDLQPLPVARRAESFKTWRDLLMQNAVSREQLEGVLGYAVSTYEESTQGKMLWSRVKIGLSREERRAVNAFVEEELRHMQTAAE